MLDVLYIDCVQLFSPVPQLLISLQLERWLAGLYRHITGRCTRRNLMLCCSIICVAFVFRKRLWPWKGVSGGRKQKKSPATTRRRPNGIPNIGNTCFMNALIQVLCVTPNFRKQLKRATEQTTDYSLISRVLNATQSPALPALVKWPLHPLFKLFNVPSRPLDHILLALVDAVQYESDVPSTLPQALIDCLCQIDKRFEGKKQQDSYEFYNKVIGELEDLSEGTSQISVTGTDTEQLMKKSPISLLFGGQFCTIYRYSTCEHVELVFQRFTSIPVQNLPKPQVHTHQPPVRYENDGDKYHLHTQQAKDEAAIQTHIKPEEQKIDNQLQISLEEQETDTKARMSLEGEKTDNQTKMHSEQQNTDNQTRMSLEGERTDNQTKMSSEGERTDNQTGMISGERTDNQTGMISEGDKTDNQTKMSSEAERTDNQTKMITEGEKTDNQTRMISEGDKTDNQTKMSSESQRTDNQTKMSSDAERTDNQTKMSSEAERTDSQTRMISEGKNTDNQTGMSSEGEKTDNQTGMISEGEKIDNQTKMSPEEQKTDNQTRMSLGQQKTDIQSSMPPQTKENDTVQGSSTQKHGNHQQQGFDDMDSRPHSILKHTPHGTTDLERGLTLWTDVNRIDALSCKTCGSKDPGTCTSSRILCLALPPVLVLQFNRFQNFDGILTKLNRKLSFPEFLDTAPFCSSAMTFLNNHSGAATEPDTLYRLYGVVCHVGSIHRGHYTAHVRTTGHREEEMEKRFLSNEWRDPERYVDEILKYWKEMEPDNEFDKQPLPDQESTSETKDKWYTFDDTRVVECTLENVLSEGNAYILLYERVCK